MDGGFASIDVERLFAGLEGSRLLLAVSGGPDSVALMSLAARWARRPGAEGTSLHVATVDHGLRSASRAEADRVGAMAATLGLPHAVLPWEGPKPETAIQERARAARYALLLAHARALGATHLLTGHHADDQAETILFRLARGSGVTGLAGMRRDTQLASDVRLVRPLLDLRKAELVAFCQHEALDTIDDPSNRHPAHARTRLRAQAATLATLGFDVPVLLRLAHRMAQADDALEAEARRLECLVAPVRGEGLYRAAFVGLDRAEPAIIGRLLRRAIEHAVARPSPVPLCRLERLTAAIREALVSRRPHRATLGGAMIVCGGDGMIEVTPEPIRRRGRARPPQPLPN